MDPEPTHLLDSSALLALIEDEPGSDRVEELIGQRRAALSALALLEVFYISMQERGQEEAERRYLLLKELGLETVWRLDEPTLLVAGRFKAEHRISLADAWIAATAARRDLVLVHKDPELESLAGSVRLEPLPYKDRGPSEVNEGPPF